MPPLAKRMLSPVVKFSELLETVMLWTMCPTSSSANAPPDNVPVSVEALAAASADRVKSAPLPNRITSPLLKAAARESTAREVAPLE
jgi:hypothetical protein